MVDLSLKPDGRTLAYFGLLKPAEQKLLDACRSGEIAVISEQRPNQGDDNNIIVRATFLRFLALGGDEHAPVHEKGVLLYGAWVDDALDLEGATLPHSLVLTNCRFSSTPILSDSHVRGCVSLNGCHVKGLKAERMVCTKSVFLNDGFIAIGTVHLPGTQIGGTLKCDGGKFDGMSGDALSCEHAVIKGGVFLNNFTATGTVRLMEAQIEGSLECRGAKFNGSSSGGQNDSALTCENAVIKGNVFLNDSISTGEVCLSAMQIDGSLECVGATFDCGTNKAALRAEGMRVTGAFMFYDLKSVKGTIHLPAVKVGSLIDDAMLWSNGQLILDGFVYDRLAGQKTPMDAKTRLKWLDKQYPSQAGLEGGGKDFKPQPWRQLQKVFREMGCMEEARQVAIAFEDRLREANLIGQTPEDWCKATAWAYRKISRGFHWLFGWFIGYGYRPLGLLIKMLVVWLICGAFYWYAALYGDNGNGVFAPSNPAVFQNPEYAACVPESCAAKVEKIKSVYATLHEILPPNNLLVFQNTEYASCVPDSDAAKAEKTKLANAVPPPVQGAGNWYLCSKLREEYTGFSPLAYSMDLILPLVDLQQEHDWAPMTPTPKNTWIDELKAHSLKHVTRLIVWFEILFGWMSSLLLVAVVSGLTKRREE